MSEDQEQMMERARWLEQRQAGPPTPHVHPDTVNDLERRIGFIEQHVRDQGALPPATETVYAHVERTVHALLDEIGREATARLASPDWTFRVKALAEAVQALSSWPQFNPMNAAADYRKIAEYEVERAVKAKQQLPGCTCPVVAADPANHYKDCDGRKESPR